MNIYKQKYILAFLIFVVFVFLNRLILFISKIPEVVREKSVTDFGVLFFGIGLFGIGQNAYSIGQKLGFYSLGVYYILQVATKLIGLEITSWFNYVTFLLLGVSITGFSIDLKRQLTKPNLVNEYLNKTRLEKIITWTGGIFFIILGLVSIIFGKQNTQILAEVNYQVKNIPYTNHTIKIKEILSILEGVKCVIFGLVIIFGDFLNKVWLCKK